MSEKPTESVVSRLKHFIFDDVQSIDADPEDKIVGDGMSVLDAQINNPKIERLGQWSANGSRASSVRADPVLSSAGTQDKTKFSRDGHLMANISI